MDIRLATEGDLDGLLALREAVAAEGRWIGAEVPLDLEGDRARYRAAVSGDSVFVAEVDGRVVGMIALELAPYLVADLGMMVADGHRGRGLGSALLARGIGWARERGAHKVALQHWPHNEAAHRLYRRFGFEQEGYLRRHYPRKDGSRWDAVVMGLLLDED